MKKLTVVDPTLFYLQAGLSVAFPPYVPRQQASKESSLDTSHSYACKPARNERHIINIECFLISPFKFPKISTEWNSILWLTVPDWKCFRTFRKGKKKKNTRYNNEAYRDFRLNGLHLEIKLFSDFLKTFPGNISNHPLSLGRLLHFRNFWQNGKQIQISQLLFNKL